MDPTFFKRLAGVLAKSGWSFERTIAGKLKRLLLRCWATENTPAKGSPCPPWCLLSDPALARLVSTVLGRNPEFTEHYIRKT